jgi:hypothetical protein
MLGVVETVAGSSNRAPVASPKIERHDSRNFRSLLA